MSHGDTKDDGNNPPSPPFSKGGISANFPFDKGRNPLIPPLEKGDTGGFSGEKTGLENASMENIDRIHYDKALTEYYQHRGWTNEGIPGDHKLKKLGLWKS
jgi:hypothetical protein